MFDRNTEMDMTEGPLFKKLVAYAIPIMLTGILQLLFNAADLIVVGRFAGRTALAAVGSTTSLTNLLVNVFMMISIGVSVAVAQHYGAHEPDEVERTVSTAMLMSLLLGAAVCLIGMAACKPMLKAMGSPDDVIDQSVLYMRIYFTGMPAFMVYNFGASALRAVGDTRRPMQFLTIAGIINVILNVITVVNFKLGVAGVAIATSVSQYISAIFVVLSLVKTESCLHLDVRHMRIHKDKMLAILKVGLPAGLQSLVFSISNVVIQSSVNSFGSAVMAGSAASNNVEGFIYTSMNAVVQSAMAFTGQNIGARKFQRIGDIVRKSILLQMIIAGSMAVIGCAFSEQLISIYAKGDAESIAWGVSRLRIISGTYFIMGISDVAVGAMRGMGNSTVPMAISIFGICVLRIVWIYTVFAAYRTFEMLVVSYPISWIVTLIAQYICYGIVKRRTITAMQSGEKSI